MGWLSTRKNYRCSLSQVVRQNMAPEYWQGSAENVPSAITPSQEWLAETHPWRRVKTRVKTFLVINHHLMAPLKKITLEIWLVSPLHEYLKFSIIVGFTWTALHEICPLQHPPPKWLFDASANVFEHSTLCCICARIPFNTHKEKLWYFLFSLSLHGGTS